MDGGRQAAAGATRLGARSRDAAATDLGRRIALDWIEQNPFVSQPGWDGAYLPRRVACWSAALGEHGSVLARDEHQRLRQSLFLQARFLAANLERHPAGARLVAGLRTSDVRSYCDGKSFAAFFGQPPACNQIIMADYCTVVDTEKK